MQMKSKTILTVFLKTIEKDVDNTFFKNAKNLVY